MSNPGETASWISTEMRGLVGRALKRKTSFPISASDIRKWAMATYYPEEAPSSFLDDDPEAFVVAPEEFNPFAWRAQKEEPASEGGFRGFEEMAGVSGPATSVMLNGGADCRYGVPMRVGDVIRSALSIITYTEKNGKRGPMLFTEVEDRWVNQRDDLVRVLTLTSIRY